MSVTDVRQRPEDEVDEAPLGVSGSEAARLLDISYRRVDHHLRTLGTQRGPYTPGSGHPRSLTPEDLFVIGMIAMIRDSVGGTPVDFDAMLPRLYRAFDENARIVLDTGHSAVTVVVDGNDLRDAILDALAPALDEEPEVQ